MPPRSERQPRAAAAAAGSGARGAREHTGSRVLERGEEDSEAAGFICTQPYQSARRPS